MQRLSVFVLNRLKTIDKLCNCKRITFKFTEGNLNPTDALTRPLSYKVLLKTNYLSGHEYLVDSISDTEINVVVPNPLTKGSDEVGGEFYNFKTSTNVYSGV